MEGSLVDPSIDLSQFSATDFAYGFTQWINNEDIPDVMEAEVDEIIDAIEADEELAVDVDQHDEVNDEEEGCTSSLNCNNSTTSTHSYLDAEAALSLLREYVIQEGDTEDASKYVNILAGRIRSKRLAKIVNNTQTTIYDYFA